MSDTKYTTKTHNLCVVVAVQMIRVGRSLLSHKLPKNRSCQSCAKTLTMPKRNSSSNSHNKNPPPYSGTHMLWYSLDTDKGTFIKMILESESNKNYSNQETKHNRAFDKMRQRPYTLLDNNTLCENVGASTELTQLQLGISASTEQIPLAKEF